MAYEFEQELRELVVKTLKRGHQAYLAGEKWEHMGRLREAWVAIDNLRQLGLSPYNPRYLWADQLTCEWQLADSFRYVKKPHRLVEIYRQCQFPFLHHSQVFDRQTPYLPEGQWDVFTFYGVGVEQGLQLAEELEEAERLYGSLTDGGAAGLSQLYRAGLARRQGQRQEAQGWLHGAMDQGEEWLKNMARRQLRQWNEEEKQ